MTLGSRPLAAAPRPALTTERILVIDDEQSIRATLEEFLGLSGFAVDTAENGAEGLDLLGKNDYDLVVSDVRMPGVDGIAVIEWMKETCPGVPVIIMSGHVEKKKKWNVVFENSPLHLVRILNPQKFHHGPYLKYS